MKRVTKSRFKVPVGAVATSRKRSYRGQRTKTQTIYAPTRHRNTRKKSMFLPFEEWNQRDLFNVFGEDFDFSKLNMRQTSKKRLCRSYSKKKKTVQAAWQKSREDILRVIVTLESLGKEKICMFCDSPAMYRCRDCGEHAAYCEIHVEKVHRFLLHLPEVWKVGLICIYNPIYN